MVNLSQFQGGGGGGSGRGKPRQQPFALRPVGGGISFAPELFPQRIQVTKERDLNREKDYCKNEDVTDNGSKNRDIHIAGLLTRRMLPNLNTVADSGEEHTLVTATWSGEVLVDTVEVEGPTGWWPEKDTMFWKYRIDVVSTGRDEDQESGSQDGIISGGESIHPSDRQLYEAASKLDEDSGAGSSDSTQFVQ